MKPIAKKLAFLSAATFVVTLSFFVGLYVNAEKDSLYDNVGIGIAGAPQSVDMRPFWKAWEVIQREYVPTGAVATTTVTDEAKVYGAIKGLAESLGDPFTTFLTPDEAKSFKSDLSGSLQGIGAILGIEKNDLTVVTIIKASPAEKAGLIAGDVIVKVNDTPTAGLDMDKSIQMIRGPKGTSVTLTIRRDGREFPMSIVRDNITTPVVTTKQYPNGVYLITLASFTETAPDLFRTALRDYVNSGSTKLIIDMRNNTGGYLDASIDIASWFLPTGQIIVTEDYGKSADPLIYRSKGYNLFNQAMKVVILVNENTASASEILAGALRDNGKAVLVGETTYGKGSVQELVPITGNTILKVTVARWLTPKGLSISVGGLKPDYEAKLTVEDIKAKRDPQLDRALEIAGGLR
jgi:carboxyl-terminal processing protease